jgi:hypothetical protein
VTNKDNIKWEGYQNKNIYYGYLLVPLWFEDKIEVVQWVGIG